MKLIFDLLTEQKQSPTESQTPKKRKSIAKKQQKKPKEGMFSIFSSILMLILCKLHRHIQKSNSYKMYI